MKTMVLNDGKRIPAVGLGTWRSEKKAVAKTVEQAVLQAGYRHVDCASIYGNEKEIGQAFHNILSSQKIPRKELFVTSKLWNTDHHPEHVEAACKQTLHDLHLEYLDLYLVHWGIAFVHGGELEPIGDDGMVKTAPVSLRDIWHAMEGLVKEGLVKSIGVANFTAPMIVDLLSYAQIKPVMNQVEIHPYNSQVALVDYCHSQNIQITAYSPFGFAGEAKNKPLQDMVVVEIAKAHEKTSAQVLVRWALQRNLIVIPKSIHVDRITQNIDVFDFELTKGEMDRIYSLNKKFRFVDPIEWWGIPYFQ